tara:strand:- start:2138 stop:2977 length:840 start_codon:yes stop_codon:yes gene_type:complete
MNILVTGCKGFLARELISYFSDSHNVIKTDRTKLDPTNYENVKWFFDLYKVDVVIHTAIKGGKRNDQDNIENFFINTRMFENLSLFSDKYKMMFNFGSGAEFDRTIEIDQTLEEQINYRYPNDYYGLAKNLISKKIVYLNSNIYNLRLFGCFGQFEEPQRLIRSTYENFLNDNDAVILRDKMMDYFYAQDVARVIDFYIKNKDRRLPKDLNLCYSTKHTLSDIAFMIKNLTNTSQGVTIKNNNLGLSYTGCGKKLHDLGIKLSGLEEGVKECLKNWNRY